DTIFFEGWHLLHCALLSFCLPLYPRPQVNVKSFVLEQNSVVKIIVISVLK
ncbi:hypothetical protein BgiMline_026520, partial [Biomphalaria glabrata]